MAFMMPVVKNDWDIYRSNRSRRSSECSGGRSRKVSECRSEGPSLSTSPGSDFLLAGSPPHRSAPIALRHSRSSLPSPSKSSPSSSSTSSPPKSCGVPPSGARTGSQSSLNKFHSRLVDKLKRSLKIKDALDAASSSGVDARPGSS
ncbi:ADP-ribosylation factor-like protein 6-interacting protein 4 [Ischnura elegans]|uniref:ADP-ribosylation factor-like protein 6-interacting protein 4 n=1 Tax=Ischnura elegans TaxID=197161 RepID=UPI001ED8B520|nr:ADP-ribosylation factor-like protein 6-interacting protein 4 [Ischnura elegans]